MKNVYLKIKNKHLAAETSIIKMEERKMKKRIKYLKEHASTVGAFAKRHQLESILGDLVNHRKVDVRNEQRATFLARAYIDGKDYLDVEQTVKDRHLLNCYITPRVLKMVQKYGDGATTREDLDKWFGFSVVVTENPRFSKRLESLVN